MKITYIPKSNTYGDIPIGECFQLFDDDEQSLYIKIPIMVLHDHSSINALNLCNIYKYTFLGEDDIVIPVKTEIKTFID